MYNDRCGDRLKEFEKGVELRVLPSQPYVIRLDGCSFSKFTAGLVKPFDPRLKAALVLTAQDLVTKFSPLMGYQTSDEISLVFAAAQPVGDDVVDDQGLPAVALEAAEKPRQVPRTHMYAGRVQKLASMAAGYTTARFNFHLCRMDWRDLTPAVQERMVGHVAYFDARVVPLPDLKACTECVYWRSNFDAFRNSVTSVARVHYSRAELHNKSVAVQLRMLEEKGAPAFESTHLEHLFGTWLKKARFQQENTVGGLYGQDTSVPVVRTRCRAGSCNWADASPEQRVRFVAAKYWPEDCGPPAWMEPPAPPLPPQD